MPEITPAPRAGTWLKINLSTPAWTPQPRAGTWLKINLSTPAWTPQPRAGTWLKLFPTPPEPPEPPPAPPVWTPRMPTGDGWSIGTTFLEHTRNGLFD